MSQSNTDASGKSDDHLVARKSLQSKFRKVAGDEEEKGGK